MKTVRSRDGRRFSVFYDVTPQWPMSSSLDQNKSDVIDTQINRSRSQNGDTTVYLCRCQYLTEAVLDVASE